MFTVKELMEDVCIDIDDVDVNDDMEAAFFTFLHLLNITHNDKFLEMSTDAQLLYINIVLDSPSQSQVRARAMSRMLFGDKNGTHYGALNELVENGFLEKVEED